jgi:ankyrin repeat protein
VKGLNCVKKAAEAGSNLQRLHERGLGEVGESPARLTNESDRAGDLGDTPLHVACIQGHTEMVKLLIDRGANLFTLSEGDAPIYDGSPGRR